MIIKKSWFWFALGIVGFFVVLFVVMNSGQKPLTREDIMAFNLREHKNLMLHIHPHVTITINGDNYPIPANLGITQEGMRVIHTHETDGTLHVESPVPYQFVLADFFEIWGKRYSDSCIMEYCEDATHTLKVYVNGAESSLKSQTPLLDLDDIRIVYEEVR